MLSTVFTFAAIAASASAAHIDVSRRSAHHSRHDLHERGAGIFSFYTPQITACGGHAEYNDRTVAIAIDRFDTSMCGKKVSITVGGKTLTGSVVDSCVGCEENQLDLMPGFFEEFGSKSTGILHGSWSFGDSGEEAQKKQDQEEADRRERERKQQQAEAAAEAKAKEEKAQKEKAAEEARKKAAAEKKKEEEAAAKAKAEKEQKQKEEQAKEEKAKSEAAASSSSAAAAASSKDAAAAAAATPSTPVVAPASKPGTTTVDPKKTDVPVAAGAAVAGLNPNGASSVRMNTLTVLLAGIVSTILLA